MDVIWFIGGLVPWINATLGLALHFKIPGWQTTVMLLVFLIPYNAVLLERWPSDDGRKPKSGGSSIDRG